MNEIRKKINNIFRKRKTYKNYILINVIILLTIFIVLFIMNYTKNEINKLINEEKNKIITITKVADREKLFNYIINSNKIDEYNISFYQENVGTKNGIYILNDYFNDTKYDDYVIYTSVNNNFNQVIIDNFVINNIKYIDNVDNNVLYCNKALSKDLFINNIVDGIITLTIKNYKDVDDIINYLQINNNQVFHNESKSANIDAYEKLNKNFNIFFYIEVFLTLIISIYIYINILFEEKRNIKIFSIIGYNTNQISNIYYFLFIRILFLLWFICSIFELILSFIFEIILNIDIINIFFISSFLTLIIVLVINFLLITLGLKFITTKIK